jgi:hypothetical protein
VSIPNAEEAFDERDELKDARAATALKTVVQRLIEMARVIA